MACGNCRFTLASVRRYKRANDAVAYQMWQDAYSEANKYGFGHRLRELQILSGLVLPIWPEVEKVLKQQSKVYARRLNVVRIETTGEPRDRPAALIIKWQEYDASG